MATALINRGMYVARRDGQFGENHFEICGGSADPFRVVSAWTSEAPNYNHTTNSCTARCGHYTQVIWWSTRLVGCGVARDAKREVWVCDYTPHGKHDRRTALLSPSYFTRPSKSADTLKQQFSRKATSGRQVISRPAHSVSLGASTSGLSLLQVLIQ